ncbi:MAG: DUF5667 domain-containing protein [Patescibacteria group bacterium]|nr:DUF5667 domain-containing protein [Patescibacteria group bacterium]
MNKLKLFLPLMFFALAIIVAPLFSQAQENRALDIMLLEFENDKLKAADLGIEEPRVLPGDRSYWWQIFKENTSLFFTFNQEKKLEKLEEMSSRRLIEAQKLAEKGTLNAAQNVELALKRYQEQRQKMYQKFQEREDLRGKMLENFDAQELRHKEILSAVIERLRNRLPEKQIEDFEKINKENTLNWYNTDPAQIRQRLEKSLEQNSQGSQFRQLKNLQLLEELEETLPGQNKADLDSAKRKIEQKMADKLRNLSNEEEIKLEKYIENIPASELRKQQMLENIQASEIIPAAVRQKMAEVSQNYAQRIRQEFAQMSEEEKTRFLEQIKDKAHPVYLQFLENSDIPPALSEYAQELRERQELQIREKIQQTQDPVKLRALENSLENYPALRRQIQEQRQQLAPTSPSVRNQ